MFMSMKPQVRVVAGKLAASGELVVLTTTGTYMTGGNVEAVIQLRGGGGGKGESVRHVTTGNLYVGERGENGALLTATAWLQDELYIIGGGGESYGTGDTTNNVGVYGNAGGDGGGTTCRGISAAGGKGGRGGFSGAWGNTGSSYDQSRPAIGGNPNQGPNGRGAGIFGIPSMLAQAEPGAIFVIVTGF